MLLGFLHNIMGLDRCQEFGTGLNRTRLMLGYAVISLETQSRESEVSIRGL